MEFFCIPEVIKNLMSTYFKCTYVRFSNNRYSTNWQKLNIGIKVGCVISPLVFVLVMEMKLHSAEVNTNQITGPSMKAFMDDVTLIAESRSHMEQLVICLQELFKWAAMKIKHSKCRSLSLLKGNFKEIKFSVSGNKILMIRKKSVKSLGRCYSLPLTDRHCWQDLRKQLQNGLCSIDKCNFMNKDKIWCIYFGLIPKLPWPSHIYEVSLTKVETMEWSISKFMKKWLGVPNSLTNVALYSSSTKLKFPKLSLVEEYKLGKARLSWPAGEECSAFCNNRLEMKGKNSCWECRIGPLDERNNWHCGKWKSRSTSTALVVQRIHVKQKKNSVRRNSSSWGSSAFCYSCRTKETGCMDQVGECKRQSCHMERPQAHGTKEIKFPHKSSLWCLTNTSQPSCLGVNYIRPMQSMWENCQPQTYSHWMWVRSKKLYLET